MSTELATVSEAQVSIIRNAAQDLADAHKIGTALANTAFVPQHFKGKPEEAAAAILYGATIDMDPLTALQNIFVIGGKPALYARTMVAVVLSHGHKIWTEDERDGSVTVAGQRKGSDVVEHVTWTTDMAQSAGYTSNKKYQTDSRSMLYARASGDVARRIAPDALLGMAYSREELELSPSQITQQPSKLAQAVAERAHEVVVEPAAKLITDQQMRKMQAMFSEKGFRDRDDRLDYVRGVLELDVQSSKELTKDQASRVIDALSELSDIDVEQEPTYEGGES